MPKLRGCKSADVDTEPPFTPVFDDIHRRNMGFCVDSEHPMAPFVAVLAVRESSQSQVVRMKAALNLVFCTGLPV